MASSRDLVCGSWFVGDAGSLTARAPRDPVHRGARTVRRAVVAARRKDGERAAAPLPDYQR